MKSNFIIKLFICITMLCVSLCANCQIDALKSIQFTLKKYSHGWQRTPSATPIVLPSVFYDPATKEICFTSEVNMDELPIEISDKNENVWLQKYVTIESEKSTTIDIKFLPSGKYNLMMWIGGCAYVGIFEIEE